MLICQENYGKNRDFFLLCKRSLFALQADPFSAADKAPRVGERAGRTPRDRARAGRTPAVRAHANKTCVKGSNFMKQGE